MSITPPDTLQEPLLVLVSCPPDAAERLAAAVVERRLAACASIVPQLRSVYRWKDAVVRDDEALLLIKTTAAAFEAVRAAVVELHPYELPEVLAVPVALGHLPYLQWISQCVA